MHARFSFLFLLLTVPFLVMAQSHKIQNNPLSLQYQQQFSENMQKQLSKIDWGHVEKRTTGDTVLYYIPVVVHILHNYDNSDIADTIIYKAINDYNAYLLKTIADTINIIDKFKPIAASTRIALKLAKRDPNGNPTKGIEHIHTYQGINATQQADINQWPQDRYLNIWTVGAISTGQFGAVLAAYSLPLLSNTAGNAQNEPYYDGLVIGAPFVDEHQVTYYIVNQLANYIGLPPVCGFNYSNQPTCIDGDLIPDTPPCGTINVNLGSPCSSFLYAYDSVCADTPNIQNVMNSIYTSCDGTPYGDIMFTYGQAQFLQGLLQQDIGKRDSLVTPHNRAATGIDEPMPDLPPVPDFSVNTPFVCVNGTVTFKNYSWNDTITAASWTFSNGAHVGNSNGISNIANYFTQPGWVTASLTVTGNNTGSATLVDSTKLFIADTVATNATGYYQEFNPGGDLAKWPLFNYYNNAFKWELVNNTGYYDNTCIRYARYDDRAFPANQVGGPQGDHDDLFTPAFDLSGFGSADCNLDFMYSGASNTAVAADDKDTLQILYSTDCGAHWTMLTSFLGKALTNYGYLSIPFSPLWQGDWASKSIAIPQNARTTHTFFCFRYKPGGSDANGVSTGNNFYMDRIHFSSFPTGINETPWNDERVTVTPNPTHTNAFVTVNTGYSSNITVRVTDISGREVYERTGSNTKIEIPQSAIFTKGFYLVHVSYPGYMHTQKLLVY